jgi:DNA-binding ferritin-like protein (Dps family)
MKGFVEGIKTILHIIYATIINGKLELVICWRLYTQLPKDYQYVLKEIDKIMHSFALNKYMATIIMDTMEAFAIAAANGQNILSVTGEDVGAFCDKLLKKYETMVWNDERRKALNEKIKNRFNIK